MLKGRNKILSWLPAVLWIAVLLAGWGAALWTSESFQQCLEYETHNKSNQAYQYDIATLDIFRVWRVCGGHFVHDNGEAIIAVFTIILAISTILLWRSTHRLWEAGERQFVATFRPRIIVRHITTRRLDHTQSLSVEYRLTNVGGTDAIVFEWNGTVRKEYNASGLPQTPEYDPNQTTRGQTRLAPGETVVQTAVDPSLTTVTLIDIQRGGPDVYFLGYVKYRDDLGMVRQTGFARKIDPLSQRFKSVSEPEYDYAD